MTYIAFHECQCGLELLCVEVEIVDPMTTCCEALDNVSMNCRSKAADGWMGVDDVNQTARSIHNARTTATA